ncbi:hypothetical protein [cf. Phormidesmis sp. LEGE 11477]|uniref:hypothetical protein n=1 Tax=cf. Phormidesmis sp. LEGE 11477 TaxID=1828680 RepID=UPI001880AD7C|nr:hypothetical protein [cf. Phormidesmis sp. LEGE 11477]MBE9062570.1 hypothetical protein [cf. Phormidesmis sp. LEGE 11477]
MKLSRKASTRAPHLPSDEEFASFEKDLKQTADDFLLLRDRFFAIRRAKAKYEKLTTSDLSSLPAEDLAHMQDRIEALKVTLESHLLSWRQMQEPFWQVVRFVGLGIVIGWFLHLWLGDLVG